MRKLVVRYRWTSWLVASAPAFQVFTLALTTPMEVARGLQTAAAGDHCEPARHHGAPVDARDLRQICIGMQAVAVPILVFCDVGLGVEPLLRAMANDNGAYVLEGPELAVPGAWTIRLDVLVPDFDKASFETEISVR